MKWKQHFEDSDLRRSRNWKSLTRNRIQPISKLFRSLKEHLSSIDTFMFRYSTTLAPILICPIGRYAVDVEGASDSNTCLKYSQTFDLLKVTFRWVNRISTAFKDLHLRPISVFPSFLGLSSVLLVCHYAINTFFRSSQHPYFTKNLQTITILFRWQSMYLP